MESGGLQRSIAFMRQSLFDEGILDRQFTRLEQEYRQPTFLQGFVTGYLRESATTLAKVEQEMNTAPINFPKMDRILNRLWFDSGYIGARKIRNEIKKTRELLQAGNLEGVKIAFQDVRNELENFETKLEPYFEQRRLQARQTAPPPGEAITPRQ